MTIYSFRTRTFAQNIYLYGDISGTRLTNIPGEYYIPVEQHAAGNYTPSQILNALTKGWITQQEYEETTGYRTDTSPMDESL